LLSSRLAKVVLHQSQRAQKKAGQDEPAIVGFEMENWAPKMCGLEYRMKRAEESFFRLVTHSASPVSQPEAIIFKRIKADIKSLDVRVDDIFLGGVLSVLLAQADASAFSVTNSSFDDSQNKPDTIKTTSLQDSAFLKTCFEQDLVVPPRDSSFVGYAFISAWTITLSVKLGSPDELIPLAKRYGVPINLLVIAIRLSRLEALKFDIPKFREKSIGSEKIMAKYSALLMRAFWQQLGEVLFNVGKRVFIGIGILRGLSQSEKMRRPPEQSEVMVLYGPGAFPLPTEILIETNAVRRIEAWWNRKKAGMMEEPPPEAEHSSRLEMIFKTAAFGKSHSQKFERKSKKKSSCI